MRFSELDGLAIGVWGLGREIRSLAAHVSARLPAARIAVAVSEDPSEDAEAVVGSEARIVGRHDAVAALAKCDVLVRSPGVSIYRPELSELARRGLPITTATGLWLAERRGVRVIGITGTKGKSTTATLVHSLLCAAGYRGELAGNIGRPALDLLDIPDEHWAVVELSSYQTADLVNGPAIAALINIYKEHTDWHGDQATYCRDKARLLALPGVRACVMAAELEIACAGDASWRFDTPDGWHVTSIGVAHPDGAFIATDALPLRGRHNALNLCAALTTLDAAGLERPADLPGALAATRALPHRLELVGEHDGLEWFDDSISTTPESAIAAIEAFPGRSIVLIAGGQDRAQDYGRLGQVVAERGAALIGVPSTGHRVVAAARAAGVGSSRAVLVGDLQAAVRCARELATPGAVVLLSPAAPSYDMYRNFEERGAYFAALAAGPSSYSSQSK
jgi:UDP-N-acetylmuramoyl-L-alanine---L-glutamate ligase